MQQLHIYSVIYPSLPCFIHHELQSSHYPTLICTTAVADHFHLPSLTVKQAQSSADFSLVKLQEEVIYLFPLV